MNLWYYVILIFLSVSVSHNPSKKQDTPAMTELEKEVMETVKKWNDAFSENDPQTYFSFIHDDLTLFIASSPYRIDGKTDDREEFEWSLGKGRTKVGFFQELQPQVQILGETSALVTYHNRGAYGPEGEENIAYLKESNVLVKEEGTWKIIHIHVSQ